MDSKRTLSLSRSLGVASGALLAALLLVALVGASGLPPLGAARESAVAMPASHSSASVAATNIFTVAIKVDPGGLDPALTVDSNALLVAAQIYETLVTYEPGGSLPRPGLAQTWTASPDAKVWTFTLQPGVKFHDGTNLDAAAVLYNFARWWDPAHPAHVGNFDYFVYLFGGFKGDPGCIIAGIGAIGPLQFQMTLTQAYSPLPSALATPALAIASPTAIQAGTLMTTPVGSGPFRFVDRISGDRIRLDTNLSYRGTAPHLGRLIFQVIPDDATRYGALQANAVQAADGLPNQYATNAASDPNLKVLWRPSSSVGYMGMNRSHTPLDNLLVRRAIAQAINRQSIVANFFLAGDQVATQFLPPVIWGYDPNIVNYTYDPALARSLLTLAGYPNGITTTLAYRNLPRRYFPNISYIAEVIQYNLMAAGIHTTLTVYESGVFLQKMWNGELDLFLIGWGADYLHPDHFFFPILCDTYLAYGPRDDALCDQLTVTRATLTFAQQLSQYQSASRHVHDTLPLLPVGHSRGMLITRRDVFGLQPSPMGIEAFKDVYFGRLYLPLIHK